MSKENNIDKYGIECPKCGDMVDSMNDVVCPNCGRDVTFD